MPNNVNATYSVSEVTDMFWNIIKNQSALQNVWVHGKIAAINGDIFFNIQDLGDPDNVDNEIQCLIPAPLARNVSSVGAEVFVKGSVILIRDRGVYRFSVTDTETSRPNQPTLSVSSLMQTLRNCVDTLRTRIGPDPITVQGEICGQSTEIGGFTHLTLRNVGAIGNGATNEIVCTLPLGVADGFLAGVSVSVIGQFAIFLPMSRYQIDASNINELPAAPPNMGEPQVVAEVRSYFQEIGPQFSIATECEIQMGVSHRSADVVLIDPEGNFASENNFAAIAECQGNNVTGHGIKQLKSYLCATDTRFGVFANNTNRDNWVFYENLRHNRFVKIERPEFETRVVERPVTQRQLQDRVGELESECEKLRSEIRRLNRTGFTSWLKHLLRGSRNDPST